MENLFTPHDLSLFFLQLQLLTHLFPLEASREQLLLKQQESQLLLDAGGDLLIEGAQLTPLDLLVHRVHVLVVFEHFYGALAPLLPQFLLQNRVFLLIETVLFIVSSFVGCLALSRNSHSLS